MATGRALFPQARPEVASIGREQSPRVVVRFVETVSISNPLFWIDPGKLQSFQRDPGHQPFLAEDKADDRFLELGGVHRAARSYVDEGDLAVDTHLPTLAPPELLEGGLIHEAEEDIEFLGTDLEAHRARGKVIVADALSTDPQGAVAVLAPHDETGLLDPRDDKHTFCGLKEGLAALYARCEPLQGDVHAGIDLRFGRRPDRVWE